MASSTASETRRGAAGARRGGKGGSTGSGKRKPRKKPLSTRAGAWMLAHPLIAGIACTVLIAGTVALIFWFTNFSGLSSSADFVYSKF